jgi:acyl-coenzyme A thioesterase PaaI-like protein
MSKALKRHLRWFINFWPPMLGAGIRVKRLQPDWKEVDVEMRLRFWNSNYVGTHYGGSLYSMTDPFYMVMLINILGRDYLVWDKSATIRFRRPGKGTVRAEFRLSDEQVNVIRRKLESEDKVEPTFSVEIKDEDGAVVAEVQKVLHVRKRNAPTVKNLVA